MDPSLNRVLVDYITNFTISTTNFKHRTVSFILILDQVNDVTECRKKRPKKNYRPVDFIKIVYFKRFNIWTTVTYEGPERGFHSLEKQDTY